jgi:membrane protein DedA with SNARE-associated domain
MLRWIVHLVGSLGYFGIGLLMAIENVVLPLPSEVIMPLGGFLSARGRMTLWGVVLVGTVGSVVGALPLYAVARVVGEERVTSWVRKHGKWLLLRTRDLQRAKERFARNGGKAVFFSQLLPGIRALISLPAGFAEMNVTWFIVTNFAGTLIWCAVLAYLGNLLGANYTKVHKFVGPVAWALLGALLVAGVVWWLHRRRSAKRRGR